MTDIRKDIRHLAALIYEGTDAPMTPDERSGLAEYLLDHGVSVTPTHTRFIHWSASSSSGVPTIIEGVNADTGRKMRFHLMRQGFWNVTLGDLPGDDYFIGRCPRFSGLMTPEEVRDLLLPHGIELVMP